MKINEPLICIGLCREGDVRIMRPDGGRGKTILEGLQIGRGFHWESRRTISIEGILSHKKGMLLLHLPVERYVTSVISSEMNPEAPAEFLKAHAVISRCWALDKILHVHHPAGRPTYAPGMISTWTDTESHQDYDVCPDDHCQRFQGFDIVNDRAREAVAATRGEVLVTSSGSLLDARFSKCCGGRTELFSTCWQDVDYAELQPVEDSYCDLSGMSEQKRKALLACIMNDYDAATGDFYRWNSRVSASLIAGRLKGIFNRDIGTVLSLEAVERGPSHRIKYLRIEGTHGSLTIGKELAIRKIMSKDCAYSSAFDITPDAGGFIIKGRGWGHGVGLCQIGAARMATEGAGYKDILRHYYPLAQFSKIYD